jgi:hypothetical protein
VDWQPMCWKYRSILLNVKAILTLTNLRWPSG